MERGMPSTCTCATVARHQQIMSSCLWQYIITCWIYTSYLHTMWVDLGRSHILIRATRPLESPVCHRDHHSQYICPILLYSTHISSLIFLICLKEMVYYELIDEIWPPLRRKRDRLSSEVGPPFVVKEMEEAAGLSKEGLAPTTFRPLRNFVLHNSHRH